VESWTARRWQTWACLSSGSRTGRCSTSEHTQSGRSVLAASGWRQTGLAGVSTELRVSRLRRGAGPSSNPGRSNLRISGHVKPRLEANGAALAGGAREKVVMGTGRGVPAAAGFMTPGSWAAPTGRGSAARARPGERFVAEAIARHEAGGRIEAIVGTATLAIRAKLKPGTSS
jgi:hypothetical protein